MQFDKEEVDQLMKEQDILFNQTENTVEVVNELASSKQKHLSGGGMYRNVKVPVNFLNYGIAIGILVLVATVIFLASNGGFMVNFNTEGGTVVSNQSLKHGQLVVVPSAPTKIGYSFDGWYKDETLTQSWNFLEDEVLEITTLYAKWTPIIVKVFFNLNGGIFEGSGQAAPIEVTFGKKYGDTLPTPQKDGYSFSGWYYNGAIVNGYTT